MLFRDAPPDVPGGEGQGDGAGATKAAESGHGKTLALRAVVLGALAALVPLSVTIVVVPLPVILLPVALVGVVALTGVMALTGVVAVVALAVVLVVLVAFARGALRLLAVVVVP
jgi:hypothetical protein